MQKIKAFYNEIDQYCCDWLSNLMDAGEITPGKIDNRPIQELTPDDLIGYDRCHFFAGLGGWEQALKLANWGSRFVWTGSCPCQDYSTAGKLARQSGERHLWPDWFRLIRECRPPIIFGEQVASAIAAGWLDDIAHDLEAEKIAIASAVLPACAAGGFHRRDRIWFVAHPEGAGERGKAGNIHKEDRRSDGELPQLINSAGERLSGPMANPIDRQLQKEGRGPQGGAWQRNADKGSHVANAEGFGIGAGLCEGATQQHGHGAPGYGGQGGISMGHSTGAGLSERGSPEVGIGGAQQESERCRVVGQSHNTGLEGHPEYGQGEAGREPFAHGPIATSDTDIEWILCPDGKYRAVKSGLRLLAHGVPCRVGALKAYGNAIDPRPAAEFIKAAAGVIYG